MLIEHIRKIETLLFSILIFCHYGFHFNYFLTRKLASKNNFKDLNPYIWFDLKGFFVIFSDKCIKYLKNDPNIVQNVEFRNLRNKTGPIIRANFLLLLLFIASIVSVCHEGVLHRIVEGSSLDMWNVFVIIWYSQGNLLWLFIPGDVSSIIHPSLL